MIMLALVNYTAKSRFNMLELHNRILKAS